MPGVMVEMLLVVLSVTLLLVPIQGWKHVDWPQLANSDEPEQWRKPRIVDLTDDYLFLDGEEDEVPEYVLPEVKGSSTSENVNAFADHRFQVDAHPRSWDSDTDGFQMEFVDAPPKSWNSSHSSSVLEVVCSEVGFQITLLLGSLSEVTVLGSKLLPVMDAPKSCGYEVDSFNNTLTVPFTGCNVKYTDRYSLQLLYVDEIGQTQVATASCEEIGQTKAATAACEENPKFGPLFRGKSKCLKPVATPPPSKQSTHSSCDVPSAEQLACGLKGISSSTCEMRGCCVSSSGCYYPLDACTAGNFVFAIRFNSTSIPLDPTKLIIPGSPNCKPVLVNDKVAIFKFKVTECGARSYEVGEMTIYLAEVQSVVQTLNLKYGIITRSNPLKFMVECRYNKLGASQQELASVGYMVKTPSSSLPSSIISHGLYGVTLRIAHDETYSSYFPTYHQPLRLLLGKPVYLELLLKSPKPDAVILVNYCLAYPRSAKNALVLIYEGCANPYDPTSSVLKVIGLPENRHQRRFLVQAFQFMDQKTNKYLDEEIYFMCSTEVCRTDEKTCEEQCFDGKGPQKLELAPSFSQTYFEEGMAYQVPSRPHGQAHNGPSGQEHQEASGPDGQAEEGPSRQTHQGISGPDGQADDGPSRQTHQGTSGPPRQEPLGVTGQSACWGQRQNGPRGQAHHETPGSPQLAHQGSSRPHGLAHDGTSGPPQLAHDGPSRPHGQAHNRPSRPHGQAHNRPSRPHGQAHQGTSGSPRPEQLGVTGQSACWGRRQNGPSNKETSGSPQQAHDGPSRPHGQAHDGTSGPPQLAHDGPSRPHGQAHDGTSGPPQLAHDGTSGPPQLAHDGTSGPPQLAHDGTSGPPQLAHDGTSGPPQLAHDGTSGPPQLAHDRPSRPHGQAHNRPSRPHGQAHQGTSGSLKPEQLGVTGQSACWGRRQNGLSHQESSGSPQKAHDGASRPHGLSHDGTSGPPQQAHDGASRPHGLAHDGTSGPPQLAHDGPSRPHGQAHQGTSGSPRPEQLGVTGQSACWGRHQNRPHGQAHDGTSGPPQLAHDGPSRPHGQAHQGTAGSLRQEQLRVTGQLACWGRQNQ